MNKDLVSVVMSTYNEPEEWIRSSIDSILNQDYKNIEFIIVCDNPENDGLIMILYEYRRLDNRVKIIINDVNIGLSNSLNKALDEVSGKYIVRMDSDDIAMENRISNQLDYLTTNSLDLLGAGVSCIDETGCEISKLNNFPKNDQEVRKKIIYNNCLPHPTWFGKTEVFKSLNGYREIPYAEDYDFILRALDKGFKLGNINKVLLKYRVRSSSISNKNGLKQFLVSQELVRLFKLKTISSEVKDILKDIDNIFNTISSEDEEKYYLASTLFTSAAMKLKNLNPMGSISLIKSLTYSNYYRKKIKCYMKGLM